MIPRKQFEEETGRSFDCDICEHELCCKEENDCIIEREYIKWLEEKVTSSNIEIKGE